MARVYTSSIVNAPASLVWSTVRDFNGLPDWHPGITESRIEQGQPPDQVGCVRNFTLSDGGRVRERLLALSDYEFSCSYAILDSPMDVQDYIATLALRPITDGDRTFAEWSAEFECLPERESALIELIGRGVFQAGFDALKRRFPGGAG